MTILQNKTALITGGGRRLGAGIARELHARGMNILLHYNYSVAAATELRDELCAARPDSARLHCADLTAPEAAENLAAAAVQTFGRLDALINNAAVFFPTPIGEATRADWRKLTDANLAAPFFLSQACAPHLKTTRGAIVNITDLYAHQPRPQYSVYCITKAGLQMLTLALAAELAPEIRVHAVAPGAILWAEHDTDARAQQEIIARTPLRRLGEVAEVARAVKFLLTDAEFSTGQTLHIDGGRGLRTPR